MNNLKVFLGFIPFVLYSVLVLFAGAEWAAVVGVLAAAAVLVATRRNGVTVVPAAQGLILLALGVLAFTGGPGVDTVLVKYGSSFAGLLMGLFIVATAGSMPFTAQISRRRVPEAVWHTPQFLSVNRRISTAWGLATLVLGLSHLAAAEVSSSGPAVILRLVITWALPVVACLMANSYTKRVIAETDRLRAEGRQRQAEQALHAETVETA